jgi:hypothetical protein
MMENYFKFYSKMNKKVLGKLQLIGVIKNYYYSMLSERATAQAYSQFIGGVSLFPARYPSF